MCSQSSSYGYLKFIYAYNIIIVQLTINDLKEVRTEVWEARAKWFDIGIELKLKITDLYEIIENKRGDITNCFTHMLILWLTQVDPPPTWSILADALEQPAVNLQQLAKYI